MDQEQQEPASAPRRARRRLTILVAGVLVIGLLVAAGIAYLVRGFTDRDRFRAEPPACASIEPSLHLLGFAYTTRQTENNSCYLVPPIEWGQHGISVNAVAPTFVHTPGTEPYLTDPALRADVTARIAALHRIGEPIDVAGVVVFLASPAASLITGETILIDEAREVRRSAKVVWPRNACTLSSPMLPSSRTSSEQGDFCVSVGVVGPVPGFGGHVVDEAVRGGVAA